MKKIGNYRQLGLFQIFCAFYLQSKVACTVDWKNLFVK